MFSSIGYVICIPFAWLVRVFYELTGSYGVATSSSPWCSS